MKITKATYDNPQTLYQILTSDKREAFILIKGEYTELQVRANSDIGVLYYEDLYYEDLYLDIFGSDYVELYYFFNQLTVRPK